MNNICDCFWFPCHLGSHIQSVGVDLVCTLFWCVKTTATFSLGGGVVDLVCTLFGVSKQQPHSVFGGWPSVCSILVCQNNSHIQSLGADLVYFGVSKQQPHSVFGGWPSVCSLLVRQNNSHIQFWRVVDLVCALFWCVKTTATFSLWGLT